MIPRARSGVGAVGLMQLMPDTARIVAQEIGRPLTEIAALWEPPMNITLGSRYLSQLNARFKEPSWRSPRYNAGPHRVQRWVAERPQADLEEFVDQIPFDETRAFAKRVFTSWYHYRRLYGTGPRPPGPARRWPPPVRRPERRAHAGSRGRRRVQPPVRTREAPSAESRAGLVRDLVEWARTRKRRVVLVFDAWAGGTREARSEAHGPVTVWYTARRRARRRVHRPLGRGARGSRSSSRPTAPSSKGRAAGAPRSSTPTALPPGSLANRRPTRPRPPAPGRAGAAPPGSGDSEA